VTDDGAVSDRVDGPPASVAPPPANVTPSDTMPTAESTVQA
jgi:hypothetical protein